LNLGKAFSEMKAFPVAFRGISWEKDEGGACNFLRLGVFAGNKILTTILFSHFNIKKIPIHHKVNRDF
jgi:hypothetical protein